MNVDQAIDGVLAREGGYVNDSRDAGGETNFGITVAVARANGYAGPMRNLPRELAKRIYTDRYWRQPWFDRIAPLSMPIAEKALDVGVNMGPGIAAGFIQVALNAFNRQGRDYPDVVVDGAIGPASLAALQALLTFRGANGELVMLRAIACLQGARYLSISQSRPANEEFCFGWFLNRVAI